jgi:nitrite reductase/ring-hydroxylating ferredoxin subunit
MFPGAAQHAVVRCRPGTFANVEREKIPDQRRTATRCTASGKRANRNGEDTMEEIAVGKLNDIADGDYKIFAVEQLEVGIFRTGSKVLAYENVCPHAGGPVCQGKIFHQVEEIITPDKKSAGLRFGKQRHIVCPWHGYEFDLATGCHPGDATVRLTPVKVAVRDGQVFVSVPK